MKDGNASSTVIVMYKYALSAANSPDLSNVVLKN